MKYFYQHTLIARNLSTNEIIQVDGTCTTNYSVKDTESYNRYRRHMQEAVEEDGYVMMSFGTLTLLYSGE